MSPERSWPSRRALLGVALGWASLLGGCSSDKSDPAPTTDPPASTTGESRRARVRFKGLTRLENDLSQALSLQPSEMCTELGSRACVEVHRVALGGVMPYTRGIHEPLPLRSVSSAAAVDRLVLSACEHRASLDLAPGASPVLFGDLVGGASDAAMEGAAHKLYQALLRRDENAEERAALVAFAAEQRASGASAADIATLSCYAVGTSVEALFY